jgi:hypothetical protein
VSLRRIPHRDRGLLGRVGPAVVRGLRRRVGVAQRVVAASPRTRSRGGAASAGGRHPGSGPHAPFLSESTLPVPYGRGLQPVSPESHAPRRLLDRRRDAARRGRADHLGDRSRLSRCPSPTTSMCATYSRTRRRRRTAARVAITRSVREKVTRSSCRAMPPICAVTGTPPAGGRPRRAVRPAGRAPRTTDATRSTRSAVSERGFEHAHCGRFAAGSDGRDVETHFAPERRVRSEPTRREGP